MATGAPFGEVVAAARQYAAGSDGRIEMTLQVYFALAELLHLDQTAMRQSRGQAWDKFTGQVMRAFNRLGEDGTLIKVGQEKTGPSGRQTNRGEVWFYTRQAWDAEASKAQQERFAYSETRAAWHQVKLRLAAHGIADTGSSQLTVKLDLDTWQQLLDRLDQARDLPIGSENPG